MNPRTLQTIAFALGCILAVQSATTAFAQNVATGANGNPQQPVVSAPAATSTPAAQSPDSATSGGSQGTSAAPHLAGRNCRREESMGDKLGLVIPTLNEEANIGRLIDRVRGSLQVGPNAVAGTAKLRLADDSVIFNRLK